MSSNRRRPMLGTLLVALLAMLPAASAASATDALGPADRPAALPAWGGMVPTLPAAPIRRIALGVSMLPDRSMATYDAYVTSVGGITPAIWSIWSAWGDHTSAFPDAGLLTTLRARKTVPMIWWYPTNPGNGRSPFLYSSILDGSHDRYIRDVAVAAKRSGGRVLIRFAHEMNGGWFPWGAGQHGNTPGQFVKAWRHIWRIFKGPGGVGASNVRFVWSPNEPCRGCVPFAKLYPGHGYVDYVGFTAFNWGGRSPWRTMIGTLSKGMAGLARLTRKKVIVTETGSAPTGGDKAAWIAKGYPAVYKKWPKLLAIVYFNVDSDTIANQPDWRLTTPSKALVQYRAIVARPEFRGRIR